MSKASSIAQEQIAARIAASMLLESPVHAARIPFGNQNFVYAITAPSGRYVLRLTTSEWADAYESAIKLQEHLLPLGIPLAPFLHYDLAGAHSPFPALLMPMVGGTDLVNVYSSASSDTKLVLADEVASIHSRTYSLPCGSGFGFARFGASAPFTSWASFLLARWDWCVTQVAPSASLPLDVMHAGRLEIVRALDASGPILAVPFIWDMGDRNLIVENGRVTGIVDVDNLCYGDPLFTVALASAAFEKEGWNTVYTDRWLEHFSPTKCIRLRFSACRLFWLLNFMRGSGKVRSNGNVEPDSTEVIATLIRSAIADLRTMIDSTLV